MASSTADDNRSSIERLAEDPEYATVTCAACGFEDGALDGGWEAAVETDADSGLIRYRFDCPDCGEETVVDVEN